MSKPDTLIRTRLRPPFIRPGLVARTHLQELMLQGLRGPLTLIIAPAGFGKTTLTATCAAACGMRVAWLSLEADDNRAERFLIYLIAAVQTAVPQIGGEAARLVAAARQAPPEAVLTCLINDLDAAGRELVLVLDDYQFIHSPDVHAAAAFLLEHGPRTLHLVIASRSDPALPLARLRARGQMLELRVADLRFSPAEAEQFLQDVMGLGLDSRSVAALESKTEGWIAGLQLAALSIRGCRDVDGFIREFTGTHRFIMDFLLQEVLAREAPQVQDFLMRTSILTRLAGPLCDAVTGGRGGREMLAELDKRNLFVVPLDDDRSWYRYHHLFADLLQARLYQAGPDRVAALLSRAAQWYEGQGLAAEALGYALSACDYERAARLIAGCWRGMLNTGQIETVWSWLAALPQEVVRRSAALGTASCWVLWMMGRFHEIPPLLSDAERALEELALSPKGHPAGADHSDLPAALAALRSLVARYQNDFTNAVALAERALALVPGHLPPQADAQLRLIIHTALASACDGAGDLQRAVDAYAESIRLGRLGANAAGVAGLSYRMSGALRLLGRLRAADAACREALAYLQAQAMARLPAAGILHIALSEVLIEGNHLEAAQDHLAQATELGKWSGRLDAVRNIAPALVRLKLACKDTAGAMAAVEESLAALGEPPSPLAKAELLALKAGLLVRQGTLSEAASCAQEAQLLAGGDRGQTGALAALAAARVLAARSKPAEALERLTQALAAAEADGRLGAAVELHILRSLVQIRQRHPREAEADLARALDLAEPEGYVRVFLDEGRPMQLLLAQWLAHAGAGPARDHAMRVLAQFDQPLPAVATTTDNNGARFEPLSRRELEILHLVAMGTTNQEIGRQLFISSGTVKAHTANIYRKLDTTNRTAAVARARQLRLIS